ncbi:hypothetical protein AB0L40_06140 [Patulibacter sp. NPDC049589]|uniref:hypothetical protein n=1 Tax=Patulibacter sp. NPDC049589 TaxID=3154731 RepID=UPI0034449967
MARSADPGRSPARALVLAGVAVLGGASLTGCVSTQTKSIRSKVVVDRTLLSRRAVTVVRADPRVEVRDVSVLRRDGLVAAVVVRLRNRGTAPLNDLPIAVGVRTPQGRRVVLNARPSLPYWQTHAPAAAPRGIATWVYVLPRARRLRGTAFAVVGPAERPPTRAGTVPRIDVVTRGAASAGAVPVAVRSHTDVPQYGLELYAVARRGGRVVAVGRLPLDHLGSDASARASIPLIGDARGAVVRVVTAPTLFS